VDAIKQMDFFIDDEEFIAIMGQSGSGKSTLLSIMGALNHPTRGKVLVDSLDLYSLSGEQRADFRSEYIGFIFQSFQLIPYLTVLENVKLPMAVTGQKKKIKNQMALEVIQRVGLETKAHRLPDQLSGGEQERVAIARALVNKPPIILADEPTGNLDSKTANEIMMLLQSLNDEGHTIVVVTHNSEMGAYATRSIKVQDGECFA
jgi:putative ABC transport system ATP-binding protein